MQHNQAKTPHSNGALLYEASTACGGDPRNVRRSYVDCAANSVMVGFGETYLAAFALAVGLGPVVAGLTASVPLIAGGVLQLLAPRGAKLLGSCKRWVVICAAIQAASFLPLIWAAAHGTIGAIQLFVLAALYWGLGMAGGPVWNTWIEAIIPRPRLASFIAARSRLTQLAAFLAFLAGGLLLDLFEKTGRPVLLAFVALFACAAVARLVSTIALARQNDVRPPESPRLRLGEVISRFRQPQTGRFLFYLLVTQLSVNVAAPFFTPYMLSHLNFSYAEYAALVSASYLAKIIFYPYMADFVRKIGSYRALWMAGLAISPAPFFWWATPSLSAIIFLQVLAGIAWGIFELASALLIFDRIPPTERIGILTVYNLLNALAVVVGAAIGASLMSTLPETVSYKAIFEVSAVARAASLVALFGARGLRTRVKQAAVKVLKPAGFKSYDKSA